MFPTDVLVGDRSWSVVFPDAEFSADLAERAIRGMSPATEVRPGKSSSSWEWVELMGKPGPEGTPMRSMVIGRCTEDRFTCRIWDDAEGELILIDRSESEEEMVPVFLGDYGQTPRRWTSTLEHVLSAARQFWMNGTPASGISWSAV